MSKKNIEISVGVFLVASIIGIIFLIFKVSGLSLNDFSSHKNYKVTANFNDIGALNTNAAVRIAGVQIGTVDKIELNQDFEAVVTMSVSDDFSKIPSDSQASIQTAGILGDSYLEISAGYDDTYLQEDSNIIKTYDSINLGSLISTFAGSKDEK